MKHLLWWLSYHLGIGDRVARHERCLMCGNEDHPEVPLRRCGRRQAICVDLTECCLTAYDRWQASQKAEWEGDYPSVYETCF